MDGNGNGASRILTLDQVGRKDKDAQGRVLRHNATVLDVHQIVKDECDKVHQFYLKQIPPFMANMIQDALLGYGLIQQAAGSAVPTDSGTGVAPTTDAAPVASVPPAPDAPPSDGKPDGATPPDASA